MHSDQTSKFQMQSRLGNNHLTTSHGYDANATLAEPMPNRKMDSLQDAFLKLLAQVNQKVHKHTKTHLDNEVSKEHFNLLEEQ